MEMLLLGSGASKNAGVPVATEMTHRIMERFPQGSSQYQVLAFVLGGLLFQNGQSGVNPLTSGINVEDLFNAVQLLAGRRELEAAPFVGSWHQMVEQLDRKTGNFRAGSIGRAIFRAVWEEIAATIPHRTRGFGEDRVNNAIVQIVNGITRFNSYTVSGYGSVGQAIGEHIEAYLREWAQNLQHRTHGGGEIDRAVDEAIEQQREMPGEGEIFSDTAHKMIVALRDLVWIKEPARVEYLKPILRLLVDQPRLVIATLNYDNAIELLARSNGVRCVTGTENWPSTQELQCDGDGIILLKLHGSIDWRFRPIHSGTGSLPVKSIEPVSEDQAPENDDPAVIFGQGNKLTAEGPFLDILRAFQVALKTATRLTVIGYSFADVHVNEYVARWLNSSPERRIRVIDPAFRKNENQFAGLLRGRCAERLEQVARNAEDVLEQIFRSNQGTIPYASSDDAMLNADEDKSRRPS